MKETITYMIGVFALLLTGCSSEQNDMIDPGQPAEIRFEAMGDKFVQTRAEDLIGSSSTGPNFGTFYMLQTDKEGNNPSWGHYNIGSGSSGKLSPIKGEPKLIWKEWRKEYFFRGISTPQGEDSGDPGVTFTHDEQGKQTGRIRFGDYKTGLEYFVGVTVGPKSLVTNSQTVVMNFKRQVCKLVFCNFEHQKQDDVPAGHPDKCTIIFPNLPKTASFDMEHFRAQRYVYNKDKHLVNGNDYVTFNYEEEDLGARMEWKKSDEFEQNDQKSHYLHSFYLPWFEFGGGEGNMPENKLGFFIVRLTDGQTFTGNLFGNGQRPSIYAGEYLLIENVILKDGPEVGGGDGSAIAQWEVAPPTEHPHHRLPGIYSQEDADKLLDALLNDKEIPATFYEETANGKRIIRLFKNIDWSSVTTEITIPDDYVLEGQGFHIKLGAKGSITPKNLKGELYINGQLYKDGELQKE